MQTFVHPEGDFTDLGGGTRRRIGCYNEQMMLVEVSFDAGAVGNDHSHPHMQISYVLEGAFTYHIEGVAHRMVKGDSIVVEGGKVHGCTCLETGVLLDVFTPMREDFIK